MKAVRLHSYGGNEVLRMDDLPVPQVSAADDIVVRVRSSSINPVDWKTRNGWLSDVVRLPYTLGWDVAGVVEAVGVGVEGFVPGDAVYGMIPLIGGGYAEYARVKPGWIARAPHTLPLDQAGGVPAGALTAWQALDGANVRAGETVLITGGAGGGGTFAVQLAAARGAHVIATASARNHDLVRGLGAQQVIDYTTTRLAEVLRDVPCVIDTVGVTTATEALGVMARGGALAGIAGVPDARAAEKAGVTLADIGVEPDSGQLAEIAALIDAGAVRLIIDRTVTLETIADGFAHSETGRTRGKIVIAIP